MRKLVTKVSAPKQRINTEKNTENGGQATREDLRDTQMNQQVIRGERILIF